MSRKRKLESEEGVKKKRLPRGYRLFLRKLKKIQRDEAHERASAESKRLARETARRLRKFEEKLRLEREAEELQAIQLVLAGQLVRLVERKMVEKSEGFDQADSTATSDETQAEAEEESDPFEKLKKKAETLGYKSKKQIEAERRTRRNQKIRGTRIVPLAEMEQKPKRRKKTFGENIPRKPLTRAEILGKKED